MEGARSLGGNPPVSFLFAAFASRLLVDKAFGFQEVHMDIGGDLFEVSAPVDDSGEGAKVPEIFDFEFDRDGAGRALDEVFVCGSSRSIYEQMNMALLDCVFIDLDTPAFCGFGQFTSD